MDFRCGMSTKGSSLGPVLWLLVMETWFTTLNSYREQGIHIQAYADDQLIILSGNSLNEIENHWTNIWNTCKTWTDNNKLKYNIDKTEMMFIPARGETRPPRIYINNVAFQPKFSIKYLENLIGYHILNTLELKPKILLENFCNSKLVLKLIYERVVCSMILYGSEIWGIKANDSRIITHLRALERPYLRAMTKSYKTAPTAALSILTGSVPLEVQARVKHICHVTWFNDIRMVKTQDRPHPALRGYIPQETNEHNNTITAWTDASINKDGKKAYSWIISIDNKPFYKGGTIIIGQLTILELRSTCNL
ncbi:hypothetical protein NQ317_007709 [Molorchus minor]|uniref:Reverse transcriptase domain-containing protein n=1 Tax=Molorchus minor TaxID=1323400 RepID=A0ABQ9IQN3_9CUCU|nr:hypothetical protein NQ317_007709 [Molorchus minor]